LQLIISLNLEREGRGESIPNKSLVRNNEMFSGLRIWKCCMDCSDIVGRYAIIITLYILLMCLQNKIQRIPIKFLVKWRMFTQNVTIRRKCERMHRKSVSIVRTKACLPSFFLSCHRQWRSLMNDLANLTRVVDTDLRNSMPSPFVRVIRVITRFSELIKQDPPRCTRTAVRSRLGNILGFYLTDIVKLEIKLEHSAGCV